MVTVRDNEHHIRVLLDSDYTTKTAWGVLLKYLEGGPETKHNTGAQEWLEDGSIEFKLGIKIV